MVKFTNKAKGRPSKRMTLKKKYKIQRKVKQHNKKMRRQAKNLKAKGLKHSKHQQKEALPNMFPFKQDILRQYQNKLPKKPQQPVIQLSAQQFGLIVKPINTTYFPKTKQNYSKKYVTNLDKLCSCINVCFITVDARAPHLSRDQQFEKIINNKNIKKIFIITKIDTISSKNLIQIDNKFKEEGLQYIHFTNENKSKATSLHHIIQRVTKIQVKNENNVKKVGIFGKNWTGKSTLVKSLMRYLNVYSSINQFVLQIMVNQNFKFIDSVYKINDKTNYPLFNMSQQGQQYRMAKQQHIIKQLLTPVQENSFKCPILDRNEFIMHYQIQDFISIDDMLKKIGKAQRIFGKGGMVDVNKTRARVLIDWYSGKLNELIAK